MGISIHALLAESDKGTYIIWACTNKFLSTLSLRRATHNTDLHGCHRPYFYPRSPCGERRDVSYKNYPDIIFLSTLSLRRATIIPICMGVTAPISIHALLAESDLGELTALDKSENISIHALLAESDSTRHREIIPAWQFLSTLSLRRATRFKDALSCDFRISIHALLAESDPRPQPTPRPIPNFYPRSPCGERHVACGDWHELRDFYPRSPCGERRAAGGQAVSAQYFYPRSPCGERPSPCVVMNVRRDFYPRSPCGERLLKKATSSPPGLFLSTLSLRRATVQVVAPVVTKAISIHALLAESDVFSSAASNLNKQFLSTLSLRRATQGRANAARMGK